MNTEVKDNNNIREIDTDEYWIIPRKIFVTSLKGGYLKIMMEIYNNAIAGKIYARDLKRLSEDINMTHSNCIKYVRKLIADGYINTTEIGFDHKVYKCYLISKNCGEFFIADKRVYNLWEIMENYKMLNNRKRELFIEKYLVY